MKKNKKKVLTFVLCSILSIVIGKDKKELNVKFLIFYYPSILTFALGAQKNRLIETVLLSTHNICFG